MKDIDNKELRTLVENAFKKVNKKKILSNELKELLSFNGSGNEWGGFLFRLANSSIIKKDNSKPFRSGNNKFYYYTLLKKEELVMEEFLIFEETSNQYHSVFGLESLDNKIQDLFKLSAAPLKIFKLVETAQVEVKINRNKV